MISPDVIAGIHRDTSSWRLQGDTATTKGVPSIQTGTYQDKQYWWVPSAVDRRGAGLVGGGSGWATTDKGVAAVRTAGDGYAYFNRDVWDRGVDFELSGGRSTARAEVAGSHERSTGRYTDPLQAMWGGRLFDSDPFAPGVEWKSTGAGKIAGNNLDYATFAAIAAGGVAAIAGGAAAVAATAAPAAATGSTITAAEYAALGGMNLGTYTAADVALGYAGAAATGGGVIGGATTAADLFKLGQSAVKLGSAGVSAYSALRGAAGTSSSEYPNETPPALIARPRPGYYGDEPMDNGSASFYSPFAPGADESGGVPWWLLVLMGGVIYFSKRG